MGSRIRILCRSVLLGVCFLSQSAAAESAETYVQKFIELSQAQSQLVSLQQLEQRQVTVSMSKLEGLAGVCREEEDGSLHVVLNAYRWGQYTESEREVLVFHELGHCILGREHRDEVIAVGYEYIPASIMNSAGNVPNEETYLRHQVQYLHELFAMKAHQPFIAYMKQSWLGSELFAFLENFKSLFAQATPRISQCKLASPFLDKPIARGLANVESMRYAE